MAALPAPPDGRQAILISSRRLRALDFRDAAASLEPGGAIAVTVGAGDSRPVERARLSRRLLGRIGAVAEAIRLRARAAVTARRLRASGLRTHRLEIGRRIDGYALSLGKGHVGLPAEIAVVGTRGEEAPPTLLEQAVANAERQAELELSVVRGRVLSSAVLMVELASRDDARFVLRLGDPVREPTLTPNRDPRELLLKLNPPEPVRRRITVPLARQNLGGLVWTLEALRTGTHPSRITVPVWEQCTAFVAALAASPAPSHGPTRRLANDVAVLSTVLTDVQLRAIREIAAEVDDALAELPRGWAHGDFHPGNLLVEGDQLATVLDWDAASPSSLPGLDLVHLIATTERTLRRLPHGRRCTSGLQDLATAGDRSRLAVGLSAAGIPSDRPLRQALVHAYWLTRVIRDIRTFGDRAERPDWLDANLRRPLAEFARDELR